jgi:hypothetical protein
LWRGLAALLLMGVAAIHLTLFVRTLHFNHVLAALFLVATLSCVIAAIGVIRNTQLWGWLLGLIVTAGAAAIRILMSVYPRFDFFLMRLGRPAFPGVGAFAGFGSGPFPGYSGSFPASGGSFPYGGFAGGSGFPTAGGFPGFSHPTGFAPGGDGLLMPLAIAIEVVFIAIALGVLYHSQKSRPNA